MKKLISQFIALSLAIILLVAPTVALAASVATMTFQSEGFELFEFIPDPLYVKKGTGITLKHTIIPEGAFLQEKGKEAYFSVNLDTSAPVDFTVHVIRKDAINGTAIGHYYEAVTDGTAAQVYIPPIYNIDGYLYVTLVASDNLYVRDYSLSQY